MKEDNTIEYLLQDDNFRDWVKKGVNGDYWQEWLQQNPGREEEVEVARNIILGISFEKKEVPKGQIEAARKKFWSSVKENKPDSGEGRVLPMFRKWTSYVAAIAFVVAATWGIYRYLLGDQVPVPASGEIAEQIREIALPDSTIVTLNTNSHISYNYEASEDLREVTLEGEAFFNVTKLKVDDRPQKFEVKTKDLIVSVLGTSFNVDEGPLGTTVVLEEGSIELKIKGEQSSILMVPGDKVVYSREKGLVRENLERPMDYSSWKSGVLTLEGKNLGEVSRWLERRYNIEIDIAENSKNIGLSGSVSTEELGEAIKAISLAAGVEATQVNNDKWKLN